MHYYQHNIGDYRRDTVHLSLLEHGVYRQLLDMYYLSETPIPKETQQVIRRLSARTQDEINAIEIILDEFFTLTDEGWIHKRCDMEIADYRHKAENSRNNGKKGGRPKSIQEPDKTHQVIPGNPEHNLNEPERINPLTKEPINQGIEETHTYYPSQQSSDISHSASVCIAIKKIGIIDINQSHPEFLELIRIGATIDEFMHAARTAKDKKSGFAYMLGIVKKQRERAFELKGKLFVGTLQKSTEKTGSDHGKYQTVESV